MRLFIFITIIFGICYFSSRIFTGHGDAGIAKSISSITAKAAVSTLEKTPLPSTFQLSSVIPPASILPPRHDSDSGFSHPRFDSDLPVSFLRYQFQHRQIPTESEISSYSSIGVVAVVDRSARSILLRGQRPDIESLCDQFRHTDCVPQSCVVRTWVVFVESTRQSGWDLSAAINSISAPSGSVSIGPGGALLNLTAGQVSASLDLIASNGDVSVLQRPHLVLLDSLESVLESIREVPIPSVTLTNGFSQSSVVYRKVGLQLHVTPHFLSGDRVNLSVRQENGLIGPNALVSGQSVPTFDTQSVSTVVEMSVGQCVILGGVASDRIEKTSGLLGEHEERRSGSLYVVLATESDSPRAVPVGSRSIPSVSSLGAVPFSMDRSVLPEKNWKSLFR
jgi:Bacterial type II and III secretion system protein